MFICVKLCPLAQKNYVKVLTSSTLNVTLSANILCRCKVIKVGHYPM